jgi:hypothetical protein
MHKVLSVKSISIGVMVVELWDRAVVGEMAGSRKMRFLDFRVLTLVSYMAVANYSDINN